MKCTTYLEDVNFSLIRGGVITGKITDADGRPVVEEQISLQPVDGQYAQTPYYRGGIVTDDRGVYRAFGLPYGKYKVSVGQDNDRMPRVMQLYPPTFYPSVTDQAKATLVEVTEGSEARDIDIILGRQITSFRVTGKIVDGETGKLLPNVSYSIYHATSESSSQSASGGRSNANGEFRFDGVMPGKYSILISADDTGGRAEPVPFEIVDHDVTGLVVKTVRGISVSGVVVIEGAEGPAAIAKFGNVFIYAMAEGPEAQPHQSSSGTVRPDGGFRINGLSPGVVHLGLGIFNRGRTQQLALVRVERDGIIQPNSVSIKEGEQITGLRLIVKMLTATIRGQVKVEDGELPEAGRIAIWVQPVDNGGSSHQVMYMNSRPEVDPRGRFLVEGLAGGTYEIVLRFSNPAAPIVIEFSNSRSRLPITR